MFSTALVSKFLLTSTAALAVASGIMPGVAQAGELANRIHNGQVRINQGVRSGELTQGEYRQDESRLQRDAFVRNRDLRQNDAHLRAPERANLNARLNTNSRDIYFTKHNRRDQKRV